MTFMVKYPEVYNFTFRCTHDPQTGVVLDLNTNAKVNEASDTADSSK